MPILLKKQRQILINIFTQEMQASQKKLLKTKQKQVNLNTESRLSKVRKSSKVSSQSRCKSFHKKKVCADTCKKHEFQLKAIGFSSFLSKGLTEPMTVNFCLKGNSSTLPMIHQQFMREPQVPLFILYQHYLQSHRQQFQQAVKKAQKMIGSDSQQEIIMPIPKNRNCQICRIRIQTEQQYLKHTSCNDHHLALKKSFGQKLILQETENLANERKMQDQVAQKIVQLKNVSRILLQAKKTLKGLFLNKQLKKCDK